MTKNIYMSIYRIEVKSKVQLLYGFKIYMSIYDDKKYII